MRLLHFVRNDDSFFCKLFNALISKYNLQKIWWIDANYKKLLKKTVCLLMVLSLFEFYRQSHGSFHPLWFLLRRAKALNPGDLPAFIFGQKGQVFAELIHADAHPLQGWDLQVGGFAFPFTLADLRIAGETGTTAKLLDHGTLSQKGVDFVCQPV